MSRISTFAANRLLLNQMFRTQQNVFDGQVQVTSEKKSQVYQGIADDSRRLVNIENTRDSLQRFISNNEQMTTRLDIVDASVEGVRKTIRDFKASVDTYQAGATKDETKVKTVQDDAFRALKSLEDLLNTEVDGRFLFAGARTTTEPVSFGLSNVAAFQAKFDGARVTYPTSRDAHLEKFALDRDNTERTDWLSFTQDTSGAGTGGSRITAATAQFSNVAAGTTITISGSNNNNGTYTVSSVGGGGTTIDIVSEFIVDEVATPGTISFDTVGNPDVKTTVGDNSLTFNRAASTLVYTDEALDALTVGKAFTVTGTTNNNNTFTVSAINTATNTITVESKQLTDEGISAATAFFDKTAGAGTITFTEAGANDTITSSVTGFFNNLKAGTQVVITGAANAGDNITATIDSVSSDGTTLTLNSGSDINGAGVDAGTPRFVTTLTTATVTATPYFQGDQLAQTHRVDEDRSFTLNIDGADPAFEKAIRAIGIILQGAYQSEGGLDQNPERIGQALFLLEGALDRAVSGVNPLGTTELTGSVEQIGIDLSFNRVLLSNTNDTHKKFIGFLESSISKAENVDQTEAVTKLLDNQRALEASFQAFARIRQLSLTNFI